MGRNWEGERERERERELKDRERRVQVKVKCLTGKGRHSNIPLKSGNTSGSGRSFFDFLFKSILNNKWFLDISVILFLNKKDPVEKPQSLIHSIL